MKIWLDDTRPPPDATWVWFDSAYKVIDTLKVMPVEEISLDHDLGDEVEYGDGYQVIVWIEEQVFRNASYQAPEKIHIHTQNPVARNRMLASLAAIRRELNW